MQTPEQRAANRDALTHNLMAKFGFDREQAENCRDWLIENGDLDNAVETIMYEHYTKNGEMPYGVAKARTGDPQPWMGDQLYHEFRLGV